MNPADTRLPPATAVMLNAGAVTFSCGKYDALQSPSAVQSEGGCTFANRGIGAVVDAVVTVDTGASDTLRFATVAGVFGRIPKKLGICALSCAAGLASTTSYTA